MNIAGDFEQNGFVSGVEVLPADRTDYYSEKCRAFIDSYRSHPAFSEWTYYRTELVLKWVALSPVNQFCGGMQMLRGSHLHGALHHEKTYDDSSMLKRGQQVTAAKEILGRSR